MSVITIAFGSRRRLIGLPNSYDSLIRKIHSDFGLDIADFVVYLTTPFDAEEVELDPTAYSAVSDKCLLRLQKISTEKEEGDEPKSKRTRQNSHMEPPIYVSVRTTTGRIVQVLISPSMTIWNLKEMYQNKEGTPIDQQRLIFMGMELCDDLTLRSCAIRDNITIDLIVGFRGERFRGAKPAIYLMSPAPLDSVSVEVILSHHWKFTTLWPLTGPSIKDQMSRVTWNVSARPDGTLKSLASDMKCSYLFWEAEAEAEANFNTGIMTPPDAYAFDPQRPQLNRAGIDALILPFDDFMPYLYRVLESLALTTAMRTEFIVYWLPKFMAIRDRGLDIAFDFVPQADFEKVANLDVTPKPDTVARIFLLFDGVVRQHHEEQKTLAELNDIDWPARLGIDMEGMRDGGAFRVLEWGGMEAHMC